MPKKIVAYVATAVQFLAKVILFLPLQLTNVPESPDRAVHVPTLTMDGQFPLLTPCTCVQGNKCKPLPVFHVFGAHSGSPRVNFAHMSRLNTDV